jgi:hypothetical protein
MLAQALGQPRSERVMEQRRADDERVDLGPLLDSSGDETESLAIVQPAALTSLSSLQPASFFDARMPRTGDALW